MVSMTHFWQFIAGSFDVIRRGSRSYYAWLGLLTGVIVIGLVAYQNQIASGLIVSNMRDPISWGFYIGNFTFLVGIAAAAVVLVVPAYVYHWQPIKEVVLIAELLSVAAIVMCILFVVADLGRPERAWHLIPMLGTPNFPYSLLVWDILVLNAYLVVNYFIVTYLLFYAYRGKEYNASFILPIVFLSIPLAICIHTVTAFLFMGLTSRAFWHSAILAPRFLSSAFCSGPALLLLIFQILRRVGKLTISNEALQKIGEILAYAMLLNLFFLGVEAFAEFYAPSAHTIHAKFQWLGGDGRQDIARYTWFALACNVTALVVFLIPVLRRNLMLLSGASVLTVCGIYIEKGLGLLLPGMTPDGLGEVYAYNPSLNELGVSAGIWAVGALVFTAMVRVALAINDGKLRMEPAHGLVDAPGS